MCDQIANQHIENAANNIKSSEEAIEVVKEMGKFEVTGTVFYGLRTNKFKYLKDLNWMIIPKISWNKKVVMANASKSEVFC